MRPWALVPAKAFSRSKSRLASVLDEAERDALARGFLEHVLDVVAESGAVEGAMVVTDSDDVAKVAEARGAVVVRDEATSLGGIVDAALARLRERGASGAIVLMSDLPDLEPGDVRDLARAVATDDVVIAPDLRAAGTHALGLSLRESQFPTCFGHADSFVRHLACAQALGLRVRSHTSERLGFDVDEPSDLDALRNRKRASRVSAA